MRLVIQRVRQASVRVDDKIVGQIGKGLLVLIGVQNGDAELAAKFLADKTANLRIFDDDDGKMNHSVLDVGGRLLVVSQFTLYGDCRKGRRPSFASAAKPEVARQLYETYCELLRANGLQVEQGIFQADMQVDLTNDGPVTLIIESPRDS
jgi:D-tyrosyl-tRNA(Tyr) deacylase